MLKPLLAAAFVVAGLTPAFADDFSLAFRWGATPKCDTGQSTMVDSPAFVLGNVPVGTKFLEFKMVDLNTPGFRHGGARIPYTGQKVIEAGAFRYMGPCPPSGQHRYAWTVEAKNAPGMLARVLGRTSAVRSFPE
jgi:hypothetical protein